ncbi:uncharacterized protein LOC116311391 [Oreochromis aureus]|uniref:SOWAHA-C winged helix-turn-helix domain-containing protein n=1 Tax=Oreochromis aureus TaxID=47969 RepID=A0A668SAY4_OREAU|nr:uncharacterized protein LOC116311391 [Oreochromis aureus]
MASEFTQDAVLVFLQSRGGTVKNSDLVLHFRNFIRDHADQDRNRELFKKFVNSVATVKQLDGVSHVILRKKFRGYVSGSGAEVGSSDPPWVPVGKDAETAASNKPRQKPQQKEATAPAPSGETATKTILPVAGLVQTNNNSVQENFNLRQQQVHSTPDQLIPPVTAQSVSHSPQTPQIKTPSLPTPPALDQASKVGKGQQRVGFGPPSGVTPAPPHKATSPGSEALTGQRQPEAGVHAQRAPRRARNRPSYKTAVSRDDEEEKEEEVTVTKGSAGGTQPLSAPLNAPVRVTPAPPSGQRSYSQGTEGQMLTPRSPTRVILNNSNFDLRQQQAHSAPDQSIRPVTAQAVSHIPQKPQLKTPSLPTPPAPEQASKGGELRGGFGPLPGVTLASPHRETSPGPEVLTGMRQPEEDVHAQRAPRRARNRPSYKTAVSQDDEEKDEEEVIVTKGSAAGARPPSVPLSAPVRVTPAPPSGQRSYIQGTERQMLTPRSPTRVIPNNSNMGVNFDLRQQQVHSTPDQSIRPVTAQAVSHIPQKPQLKTPSLPTPPAPDQASKGGELRVGFGPLPGVTPAPPHRETSLGSEALRRGPQPPEGGLHQEPPVHPQCTQRRLKHRQSYRTAVSYDEDDVEEVPMRRGSGGGAWPLNVALGDTVRAMSSSSPCIIDTPAPSSVPQIYIQGAEGEKLSPHHPGLRGQTAGPRLELGETTRRSLPMETALHHNIRQGHQYSPLTREPKPETNQSHGLLMSSSNSSNYLPSSAGGFHSTKWPPSNSTRALGWTSSSSDLQIRAGVPVGVPRIQETVKRTKESMPDSMMSRADTKTVPWHRSTGQLYDEQEPSARSSPLHRSTDQLNENQCSLGRVPPFYLSTGDLCDREDAASSDGSVSSPCLRQRPGATNRMSTKQRMSLSMGADLDQILQGEAREGRGTEEARRSRLHRISSSLSLRHNLSCSSLSSCSTPPRSHSLASLDEPKGEKMNLSTEASPSSNHRDNHGRQSLVPLEPREHIWLVKAAAGNWPEIYTLFREEPSLLNKKDFISGFTVLHWVAKHGDHRVLNTLGYGIEKLSLTFDVNARSNSGHTPLHIAVMHGHKNIIRLLIKKFQANVKQRDMAGKRPWQYLSLDAPLEMFHLLAAPMQDVMTGKKGVEKANTSWEEQQKQSRRLRHHASSASGESPLTIASRTKVKRSTSLAAFLKHKSLIRFQGHQVDSSA